MKTIEDLNKKTSSIFESENSLLELKVPVPPQLWKDKIEALQTANLTRQLTSCIFDMRCWQVKELGFEQVTSEEMVEMLMGEAHNKVKDDTARQVHEWVYDHHEDKDMSSQGWGGFAVDFLRVARKGIWHKPPFAIHNFWTCRFGKLDYLKRSIPYGVVLRINECKELKLFNAFNVMAPLEAWERKTDIDPIVVASVWELPPKELNTNRTVGQVAHFFLAQW